jgi:hypothetical protein
MYDDLLRGKTKSSNEMKSQPLNYKSKKKSEKDQVRIEGWNKSNQ